MKPSKGRALSDFILTTYTDAAEFLGAARRWLEARELLNSVTIGVAERVQRGILPGSGAYLAAAFEDGQIAATALMTPPFRLVVSSDRPSCRAAWELIARDLRAGGRPVPGVVGPIALAGEFAEAWSALTGEPHRLNTATRAFELRQVRHPDYGSGRLREATEADVETVVAWTEAFHDEAVPGSPHEDARETTRRRVAARDIFLWEVGGRPVSMVAKARPTAHGITVNLVYTPPEERRKGYAGAVVAALSQRLLDSGKDFCTLFTNLANPTANHIYQEIGYEPVADFAEIVFEPSAAGHRQFA